MRGELRFNLSLSFLDTGSSELRCMPCQLLLVYGAPYIVFEISARWFNLVLRSVCTLFVKTLLCFRR